MPRLNKKSTKAAIVKALQLNEEDYAASKGITWSADVASHCEKLLLGLAKDLEIDIHPEEYKG